MNRESFALRLAISAQHEAESGRHRSEDVSLSAELREAHATLAEKFDRIAENQRNAAIRWRRLTKEFQGKW